MSLLSTLSDLFSAIFPPEVYPLWVTVAVIAWQSRTNQRLLKAETSPELVLVVNDPGYSLSSKKGMIDYLAIDNLGTSVNDVRCTLKIQNHTSGKISEAITTSISLPNSGRLALDPYLGYTTDHFSITLEVTYKDQLGKAGEFNLSLEIEEGGVNVVNPALRTIANHLKEIGQSFSHTGLKLSKY